MTFLRALFRVLPLSFFAAVAPAHGGAVPQLQTPPAVAAEHQEIHATLERAAREAGEVGASARALEAVLAPHFRREEEIATPPLALLVPLSRGPATAGMRAVLPMTDALERELPQMLQEHGRVRAALERFEAAAQRAGRTEYLAFAHALAAHARQEEEILYPAAILVGRYVARTAPQR
jgi:hypothetical protein